MPPKKANSKNNKIYYPSDSDDSDSSDSSDSSDNSNDNKNNKKNNINNNNNNNNNNKNKKNDTNNNDKKNIQQIKKEKESGKRRQRNEDDDDNTYSDTDDDTYDHKDKNKKIDDVGNDNSKNKLSSKSPVQPLILLLRQFNTNVGMTLEDKMKKNKKYICPNDICDHNYDYGKKIKISDFKYIDNLSQLIELGKNYHCKINKQFGNINLRVLCELVEPLEELQCMIGLDSVKNKIIDQLLYFLQGYHNNEKKCGKCIDCEMEITCMKNQGDMLHTCISGPPGVGKTELGRCFGKIYRKMGILSNDHFKIYTRSDLVGEYLGHTAVKTQKCIDECKGGVMFIDEAYALGNDEKRDSFSKECIDTLNQNLSERRDFLCIIAGYKDSLENCFFKYNEGLNRRFTFRYDIEPYSWSELKKIFELKVDKGGFKTNYDIKNNDDLENLKVQNLFKQNKDKFPNSGGDMETLFLKAKIIHSRTITNDTLSKYVLSYNDIKKGLDAFIDNRKLNDNGGNFHSMFL
jgi:hypothetical protein